MISSLLYKTKVIESERLNLLEYLAGQDLFPKFYHKCKDTQEERAAFGSLVTLPFIPKLAKDIDPSLCFYGALSFPSRIQDHIWSDFPSTFFFLPLYEIRQTKTKTTLHIRPLSYSKSLNSELDLPTPELLQRIADTPSKEIWEDSVESVLQAIQKKKMEKVVLSRRTTFAIDPALHPLCFAKKLANEAPSTTTFALQMNPHSTFVGSSPELLYQRKKNKLQTEAVAGTEKRGKDLLEDRALASSLLSKAKDAKEIFFVKKFLEERLSSLCKEISISKKPSIVQTERLQHLRYQFTCLLQDEINDAKLLEALHPTPAVNGTPHDLALHKIHSLETHNRGLYAGSLGWISPLESSFTVTIRSALIKEGYLHAFSGAGIVEGSEEMSEWQELESKIAHWKTPCLI